MLSERGACPSRHIPPRLPEAPFSFSFVWGESQSPTSLPLSLLIHSEPEETPLDSDSPFYCKIMTPVSFDHSATGFAIPYWNIQTDEDGTGRDFSLHVFELLPTESVYFITCASNMDICALSCCLLSIHSWPHSCHSGLMPQMWQSLSSPLASTCFSFPRLLEWSW